MYLTDLYKENNMGSMVLTVDDEYIGRETLQSILEGEGYELEAIAAVVVGGTSLFGGSGGIGKTILGVGLLGILSNLLVLAGQSYEAQRIATGTIIVLAVAVDVHIRKKAA